MTPRDTALAVLVALIWGVNFVAISWGLRDISPLLFVALRFLLVIVPAVFLVPRPDVPWRSLAQVGLFMSVGQFGLVYSAIHVGLSAGLAALVLQTQVIVTIAFAAVRLGERPGAAQLAGVALGTTGLLIVGLGRSGDTPLVGLLLCLGGAFSWGWGNVVCRRLGVRSGLSLTVWSGLVVPWPLIALAAALDGPATVVRQLTGMSWQTLASAAFTAFFASLVGYSVFNGLLARHPASSVMPFTLLVPVVAMSSALLLLGERPGGLEVLGGLVLLGGVLTTLVRRPPPSPGSAAAPALRGLPRRERTLT